MALATPAPSLLCWLKGAQYPGCCPSKGKGHREVQSVPSSAQPRPVLLAPRGHTGGQTAEGCGAQGAPSVCCVMLLSPTSPRIRSFKLFKLIPLRSSCGCLLGPPVCRRGLGGLLNLSLCTLRNGKAPWRSVSDFQSCWLFWPAWACLPVSMESARGSQ